MYTFVRAVTNNSLSPFQVQACYWSWYRFGRPRADHHYPSGLLLLLYLLRLTTPTLVRPQPSLLNHRLIPDIVC